MIREPAEPSNRFPSGLCDDVGGGGGGTPGDDEAEDEAEEDEEEDCAAGGSSSKMTSCVLQRGSRIASAGGSGWPRALRCHLGGIFTA